MLNPPPKKKRPDSNLSKGTNLTICVHIYIHIHTDMHAYIHTYANTYMHTYTCIHYITLHYIHTCVYIYMYVCMYVCMYMPVGSPAGSFFDTGLFGLVETSVNLGGRAIFRRKKAGPKTEKDVKNRVPQNDVFKKKPWGCRAESPIAREMPNPERWDCRTERVHFSTRAIYVKEAPLPEAKKRRCLTRCCSLRNQKVQEAKQKQIRRDARQ